MNLGNVGACRLGGGVSDAEPGKFTPSYTTSLPSRSGPEYQMLGALLPALRRVSTTGNRPFKEPAGITHIGNAVVEEEPRHGIGKSFVEGEVNVEVPKPGMRYCPLASICSVAGVSGPVSLSTILIIRPSSMSTV
ncbi:MAG: hypothetical protein CM15mP74_37030 [Halieaceae bacterium]|nr:MAG: hypothetical protein CM15mP74_37030 [Halieaceae bacterium]